VLLQGQHATNRPEELPVLPQFEGLSLCAQNIGRKITLPVFAPTCEMSHLHAPTFPAAPTASTQTSRRVHSSHETGRSRLGQKEGEAFSLVGGSRGACSPWSRNRSRRLLYRSFSHDPAGSLVTLGPLSSWGLVPEGAPTSFPVHQPAAVLYRFLYVSLTCPTCVRSTSPQ
jgi:hypothetical protein